MVLVVRAKRLVLLLASSLALTACTVAGTPRPAGLSEADRQLVTRYFAEVNDAAALGSAAQAEFFRRTQHPDFIDRMCDLRGLTVQMRPAMSTARPDPTWRPPGAWRPPRGAVHVVAAALSAHRGDTTLSNQIGSKHVVILDGATYGFAPCPD
ncbi:hypothetical protein GCM10012275_50130 [Longimycelium tulufanense]|uniref:Lipoprotein n=1 Tax=Longimycelium tulufanense TaxID=907463 RepID=A0A8J3CIX3_9PSEU|nr:hypothetical protein [Longimycelium tulufanense]GGM73455.1 hypothetical protein GCM10012275_50130 [Longimycelium tulufanense]